jgi:hypothetical protein
MANNKMYLVCNACKPEDENSLNDDIGVLCLAKWYPSGVYYTNTNDIKKWGEDFFMFLADHSHSEVPSKNYIAGAGQENPVRLVYEVDGLPVLKNK